MMDIGCTRACITCVFVRVDRVSQVRTAEGVVRWALHLRRCYLLQSARRHLTPATAAAASAGLTKPRLDIIVILQTTFTKPTEYRPYRPTVDAVA